MNHHFRPLLLGTLVLSGMIAAQAADAPVPLPQSKQLPMNVQPGPGTGILGTASRGFQDLDLAKYGYVEDEYIISGTANVYDFSQDGTLMVKTSGPYSTRVLVRHPKDPAKFSGTVVFELPIYTRRMDWPMIWGFMKDAILERGDAWVEPSMPGSVPGLLKYNPTRYAGVGFPNPAPGGCPRANPNTEDGLKYDMISQVGAAVKSGMPGYPLAGFKVRDVIVASQNGELSMYMAVIHPHARLANGKFVFDAYMPKSLGAQVGARRINQCAKPAAAGDQRFIPHNLGVPVMSVTPQSETIESYKERRADSDMPGDQFRAYEIAGAQHLTKTSYDNIPSMEDQKVAGTPQGTPDWPFNVRCTPEILLNQSPLLDYSFHAALYNLDAWVKKGIAPPKAQRIKVNNGDTPKPEVALDQFGNAIGGVRTYFVDVPVATYYMMAHGTGVCREFGYTEPFDWGKLDTMYGSYKGYAAKVTQSVDKSVKDHFLTESDGRKIKAELKSATEPKSYATTGASTTAALR